ncbi:MAG: PilZ domain-containing protein [Planctomycetota bacterium]
MNATPEQSTPRHITRQHERPIALRVSSDEGQVLDMSAGGARLLFYAEPGLRAGEVRSLTLRLDGFCADLETRVVWTKQRTWRFRRWEAGFEFQGLDDADSYALDRFARTGELDPGWHRLRATAGPRLGHAAIGEANYYAMLGITPDVPCDMVHEAYCQAIESLRACGLGRHDLAEHHGALTKAYAVLVDPRLKSEYDAYLEDYEADQATAKSSSAA